MLIGVYTADPNKVKDAYKLQNISYKEMLDISNEGAKVLHNRSIEIGKKFNIPIITKSTFNDEKGTVINLNSGVYVMIEVNIKHEVKAIEESNFLLIK